MEKPLLFLPGPVALADDVSAASARPMIDHRGPLFAHVFANIVDGLRPIFGTTSDVLPFGSSGTGAMEAAVANCFSPGETVLACPVGIFGQRLIAIAKAHGLRVDVLDTPLGSAVDPNALASRLHADRDRVISGVLLTHNETSTGVQNDLARLAPMLREHGALTVVDSVSGLGAGEFRMDDWGYDVVVSASQKALAAPPGVAMAAVSERAWQRIEHARAPRFYFDLRMAREYARKGQTAWTPPIATFRALECALARYHEEGMRNVWRRHERNAVVIRARFVTLGFTILSQPDAHSVTVVAAVPPTGVDATTLVQRLRDECGVILSGGQGELAGKIVRMGTMGAIDDGDIATAFDAIKSITHGGA